jgi:hypothetical protein
MVGADGGSSCDEREISVFKMFNPKTCARHSYEDMDGFSRHRIGSILRYL